MPLVRRHPGSEPRMCLHCRPAAWQYYRRYYSTRTVGDVTSKRSVSLPDDVAEWLDQQPNVSAAIAAAVRAQMAGGQLDEILRRAGIEVTATGKRRWRKRLARPIPADALAEGRRLLDNPR